MTMIYLFQHNIVTKYIFERFRDKNNGYIVFIKNIYLTSWWEKLPVHVLIKCFPNCFIITYNWTHTVQFCCFMPAVAQFVLAFCFSQQCQSLLSQVFIFKLYFLKLFSVQDHKWNKTLFCVFTKINFKNICHWPHVSIQAFSQNGAMQFLCPLKSALPLTQMIPIA